MTVSEPVDDLIVWLRTQIDEDEAALTGPYRLSNEYCSDGAHWEDERVLAECEAKRKLIERGDTLFCECDRGHPPTDPATRRPIPHHYDCTAYYIAQVLALPYVDRPGYRQEWRSQA